ncbi:MAG: nucleotidyltransferase family protein [Deltaproteobacteria bacterium]|nr:nucleotidyltransferase family protein [Deltaproteobacteria bacterium]
MPIILAGGLGSRLSSVLADRPKPLAPVAGRPFVTYLLQQLADAGFTETVLATGHLGELFPEFLGTTFGPLELVYSRESTPLGTGGGVRLALASLPEIYSWFLVLNGDSLVDVELAGFLAWAQTAVPKMAAKLVVVRVCRADRYGTVRLDGAQRILDFQEKLTGIGSAWINAGVYLFSRKHLERWRPNQPFSLERDCLPWLAAGGQLYGWQVEVPFIDIGLPETYRRATAFLQGKKDERFGASGKINERDRA